MVACRTQFAEPVEKRFRDPFQLLDRSGQHRIGGGAAFSVPSTASRSSRHLRKQIRARLVDIAVDQVLQAAGLASSRASTLSDLRTCRTSSQAESSTWRRSRSARPAPAPRRSSGCGSTGCASGSGPPAPG